MKLGLQVADIYAEGTGEAIKGVGVEGQGAVGDLLHAVAEFAAEAEQGQGYGHKATGLLGAVGDQAD